MKETKQECIDCGGKCCQIYSDYSYFGCSVYESENNYEVSPLFDRNKVSGILNLCKDDNEGYIKNLLANNIDPSFCEYRHPKTGCLITRDKRPVVCTKYYCGNDDHAFLTNCTPSFPTKYWDKYGVDLRLPRVNSIRKDEDYTYYICPYCGEEERRYKGSSVMSHPLTLSNCNKGYYVIVLQE